MTRFCTQCGQPIVGNGSFCTNCGAPVPPPAADPQPQQQYYNPQPDPQPQYQQTQQAQQVNIGTKPKSHLALSILVTILCCWPFGIPAIVYSAKVNNRWNEGDAAGAQDASKKAMTWIIVSAILGIVGTVLYILIKGIDNL